MTAQTKLQTPTPVVISAKGQILGRLATEVANTLRGKSNPSFRPHKLDGQAVIVTHAESVIVTGRKREQKTYYHHSGFIGHLKSVTLDKVLETKPEWAIRHAVRGMLPNNRLRDQWLAQLTIKRGE